MQADTELELLKKQVTCPVVLERAGQGWQLDRRGSTKNALKYRGGSGRIIVVNHQGRGWWDATSDAKGDIFNLVQHLRPELNFGETRKLLRTLVGIAASYPVASTFEGEKSRQPAERWAARPRLRRGDRVWSYLKDERGLPGDVLDQAGAADHVRSGAYDSAWFAHRCDGAVTHVEIRGPSFKGSLRGGSKTLFRFAWSTTVYSRIAVLEAPIDALSLAGLEGRRGDTLYVATGGGIGPKTIDALQIEGAALALRAGTLVIGTDGNAAGDRHADRLREIAAQLGLSVERLRPPEGEDWNDVLKRQGRGGR